MKRFIVTLSFVFFVSCLFSQPTEFTWDTVTFESPCSYISIDSSSQNIWQIGVPNKTIFNSAYTPTHAIVTDTINYYPINNHSYFDLYIGHFNIDPIYNSGYYPGDIFIEIKHKFNTDTLLDGGFISVSWDKGNTFINIINDTIYQTFVSGVSPSSSWNSELVNLYDTTNVLFNGEHGFSGSSNGWITTKFCWHYIPCKKNNKAFLDTMILRFNFISDSINNNMEGWMIDNIRLYSVDLGGNIKSLSANNNISISPNPFKEKTEIRFDKNYNLIDIKIYNLQGILIDELKTYNQDKVIYSNNHLPAGMYFCKINIDNKISQTKKLIIEE